MQSKWFSSFFFKRTKKHGGVKRQQSEAKNENMNNEWTIQTTIWFSPQAQEEERRVTQGISASDRNARRTRHKIVCTSKVPRHVTSSQQGSSAPLPLTLSICFIQKKSDTKDEGVSACVVVSHTRFAVRHRAYAAGGAHGRIIVAGSRGRRRRRRDEGRYFDRLQAGRESGSSRWIQTAKRRNAFQDAGGGEASLGILVPALLDGVTEDIHIATLPPSLFQYRSAFEVNDALLHVL